MSATTPPSRRRPKPKMAVVQTDDDGIELWDEYISHAEPDVEPWRKKLPDGTLLETGCPSSEAIEELTAAQSVGDVAAMVAAIFGDDSDVVLHLTRNKAFTVRVRLINDVMMHYGMSLARLPESAASST